MSDTAHLSRPAALVKLLAAIVAAGALVAGLLLPLVGGSGLVARDSASLLDALPVTLTDQTPTGNTKVLAADGSLITEFYAHNRTPVTSDRIAPVMKQALVDIEDTRFYQHNGLDVQGTARALVKNVTAGGVEEGGSTLTQQLVKQTLLQTATTAEDASAATAQTVGRKLKEARLALALEEKYSKDEILTRYLNIVYFGEGAYGIQAAAQKYFSVDAADLTLPQASVLAGLVQSPTNDDPLVNPDTAATRRNQVLTRMHTLGHVTDSELADISASPVPVAPSASPPRGCTAASIGGFFCDYLQKYLVGTLGLTQQQLDDGGYTVQTTLRTDMQAAGDRAVLATLPMGDDLVGTYTAVEPGTGKVLAMSVNRRYGCSDPDCGSVNFNVVPSKGSGSTFKLFTAAAALEQGYSKYYTLTTGNRYTSRVYKDGGKPYTVPNAGNYPATLDMEQALYMSSNTYFLGLEDALGSVQAPVQMAERMGMTFTARNQYTADKIIAENRGSFTFGTDAVSPLELAGAYATIAARGTHCTATPVAAVLDAAGRPLRGADGRPVVTGGNCTPHAVPRGVADTLNQMMRKDVEPGNSGQTAARAYIDGHQIAGKTGTINNNDSVSFVGSTPEYTASVLVFNSVAAQSVGGFGGGKGATIWHDAMAPILGAQPTAAFPAEDPVVANGNSQVLPACASPQECSSLLTGLGLTPVPSQVDSGEAPGSVVGLDPPVGGRAIPGQIVTVLVSNGSGYTAPPPVVTPPQQGTGTPGAQTPGTQTTGTQTTGTGRTYTTGPPGGVLLAPGSDGTPPTG